ncbi:hypothetical protein WN943_024347 [Citrus x changshan-huyou]
MLGQLSGERVRTAKCEGNHESRVTMRWRKRQKRSRVQRTDDGR